MSIVDSFSASLLRSQPLGRSVRLRSRPPSSTSPTYSIVVPAFNEEGSLPMLIKDIELTMRGQFYEVVLVDDGSTDGTWNLIRSTISQHRHWQGVRLTRTFGHQAALFAGINVARGRAVITLDADGQHPVQMIERMIAEWKNGAKVVQMIRKTDRELSWFKRYSSAAFYRIFAMLSDVPVRQAASDFRLMDRAVVDVIIEQPGQTPFFRGLIPWLGFHTVEVPYAQNARMNGKSKYSVSAMSRLAADGITSFSVAPLRILMLSGALAALLSFAYLCIAASPAILAGQPISTWRIIAGLIAIFGGGQLFAVGVAGEYIGRLYHASLSRPPFVIAEKTGLVARKPALAEGSETEFERRSRRRAESVRLVTTHIGEAEQAQSNENSGDRDMAAANLISRIEKMRCEEATYTAQTT